MTKKLLINLSLIFFFFASINFISCGKPVTVTPTDPCAGKTIVVTATTTATSGGSTTNGSINASATGSTGFTFSLNNGAFQPTGVFTNLAAGTYSVIAKDATSCAGSQSFTVTASACPTVTITATTTPASSPTATNGSITATATGSTGFTYNINNGTFQANGSFTALGTGTYNVTAKDLNGCTTTTPFIVGSTSCPTINVTVTTTNTAGPTATNGSITASATGGVSPYTFSRNGTTFQGTGLFSNLTAGNYTVVVKDANGCLGSSASITVASDPCPTITLSSTTVASDKCTNNTGSITLTSSGSTGLMYNLNSGAYQTSSLFNALATGSYNVGVRDANGCIKTATAFVSIAPSGPLFTNVKNIMTANCTSCHSGTSPQGGVDLSTDCNIVLKSGRIKIRAVDGVPSIMPASGAISAADKQKILDWINAGGQNSN